MSVFSQTYRASRGFMALAVAGIASLAVPAMVFGAAASYVYTTEFHGETLLTKFNGTDLSLDQYQYSAGSLASGGNSSGGGLSLITGASFAAVSNPGVYGHGATDLQELAVGGSWVGPGGRHGKLGAGPDFGIYRATANGLGAPGKELFDATIGAQGNVGSAIAMGDFQHDVFSANDGHTYIQGYDNDSYIDVGAFTIAGGVQGANGAIIQKSTGDVVYMKADGSQTTLAVTALANDGVFAKAGDYAFFNAYNPDVNNIQTVRAFRYNATTNTLSQFSGLGYTAAVRVGTHALVQFFNDVYQYDSDGTETGPLYTGQNHLTAGLAFGDYALAVINGETKLLRDNGLGYDLGGWTGVALDLTRATGGYSALVPEAVPEPTSLGVLGLVGVLLMRRRK